jgi:CspA family cold shock protein
MEDSKDTTTYTGTVIFFINWRGYGFIQWAGQPDIFFHFSDIVMNGYKKLDKGDTVTFKVGLNRQGIVKAIEIEKA